MRFALRGQYYWAVKIGPDLGNINVFALAATLLQVSPGRMEDMTLILMPRGSETAVQGFYLLAGQYAVKKGGGGHGEFLLDHSCGAH